MDESESDSGDYPFSNIELATSRKYDCVLVFDEGSRIKEWSYQQYDTIQYDYLHLLDADDIEDRKNRFPHHGANFPQSSDMITIHDFNKNERKLVIKALKKLDIKCKSIHSLNRRHLHHQDMNVDDENENKPKYRYYYVGITEEKCRKWAHQIGYNLEIEPESCLTYLSLHDENLAKATINNDDDTKSAVKASFWRHVYVQYDMNVAPQIYKEYYGINKDTFGCSSFNEEYEPSLFTIRDRITLINDAVTQDVEVGGAGMYIPKLQDGNDHCIADFFPLHTLEHLEIILNKLFSLKNLCRCSKMFNLPLKEIRHYFGEYFAIYFAFLQFLTWYFLPLVVIGIIFGVLQILEDQVLMNYIWVFSLIVIIWAVLLPLFWKRKELKYSKKWGTLRFNDEAIKGNEERTRPEFIGQYRTSIIDGTEEEFFDPNIQNARRFIACSVVLTFFLALIGSIAAIILLRIYVMQTSEAYGSYIVAAANTVVIMFFNNIYGIIAEKLNEWENYKTETEYENNLIIKIFIFRFVNSYASLYYIAFFRVYEEGTPLYCEPEQCMTDLRIQLSFIFLSQLIVNNILELLPLFIRQCLCSTAQHRTVKGGSFFNTNEADFIYNQYISNVYGRTFDDYCELLIIFGYSTLFVICFPFAPFFAFIALIVEARVDGYKLCKLSRRPFPRQCKNIGSWQLALEVLAWSVLITNTFIICFTTELLDMIPRYMLNQDIYFQEVITSMILVVALILLVILLNKCIGGTPRNIHQHIRRQNHIEYELKKIGTNIDKYIDSIISSNDTDFYDGWKNWTVDKVAIFLHKVLFENKHEFDKLKKLLKNAKFDGKAFAKSDEIYLEKCLNLNDDDMESYYLKKFILNAKEQLIKHQELAQHQNSLVASVALPDDGRDSHDEYADHEQTPDEDEQDDNKQCEDQDEEGDDFETSSDEEKDQPMFERNVSRHINMSYQQSPGEVSVNMKQPSPKRKVLRRVSGNYFKFTYQNLYGMAMFFENELKEQSKRKLWRRIEKDMVDVVQKHELDSFLYLTIIVYVKGKYPNAKVPKYKDKKFRKSMLNPLKNWLLDFKISPPGLTLQQFNTYYSLWIKEFYTLKNREMEQGINYHSIIDHPYHSYQNQSNPEIQIGITHHSDHDVPIKKAKKYHQRHRTRRERHHFMIPINENKEEEKDDNRYSMESRFELMSEAEIDYETRTKTWNKECHEWFNRMAEIEKFIESTLESTRMRVWDKFDKQNKQKLDTLRYLPKLIYSFIVLTIKSKSKKMHPPKYKSLHALTKYFANDMIQMLPTSQKSYITKEHFCGNISVYFKKIVEKRSKLIHK